MAGVTSPSSPPPPPSAWYSCPVSSPTKPILRTRMYVVFDHFEESEGAWVDGNDDWSWAPMPPDGLPRAVPVPGAWRPGLYAEPVEKIYLARVVEADGTTRLFVKWKGLAHIHCQWVPQRELEIDPANKQRVHRFLKVHPTDRAHLLTAGLLASSRATWPQAAMPRRPTLCPPSAFPAVSLPRPGPLLSPCARDITAIGSRGGGRLTGPDMGPRAGGRWWRE
jgi:hypothetical protein